MKYIIIILLVILIVVFTAKKSIEYKKEKLEEKCDFNCGKHLTEGTCLSCEKCGVCKIVNNNKISTYCLPGNEKGSYFNEQCKGDSWSFRGENQVVVNPQIVLTNEPKKYNISSYTDILKDMRQPYNEKNTYDGSTKQLGTTIISEESEKKLGITKIKNEISSYNDVLLELDNLSKFFK